jgi:hypothetical protein
MMAGTPDGTNTAAARRAAGPPELPDSITELPGSMIDG